MNDREMYNLFHYAIKFREYLMKDKDKGNDSVAVTLVEDFIDLVDKVGIERLRRNV